MTKRLNKRIILSISLDLEDKYLSSSDRFVSYIQIQIKEVYHVVIDRAIYNNILIGQNLLIFYSNRIDTDFYNYSKLTCYCSTLDSISMNKLVVDYPKYKMEKEIILLYALFP